jgi:predicted nucleotidyltransferase
MKDLTLDLVLSEFNLDDKDIFNVYQYGSRVYGTFHNNSDWDFIIVANQSEEKIDSVANARGDMNATIYSLKGFVKALNAHEIQILECFYLPHIYTLKEDAKFTLCLDLGILRESISEKSSHSWCKAKKKFLVREDYDYVVARKSFFHSIRIIMFGIQLAKEGHIYDYHKANYIWYEILNTEADWYVLKDKYQNLKNSLITEFRKLAPKRK